MRTAQNHSLRILIGEFSIQIIEIHLIGAAISNQRTIDHFPAVGFHFSRKWVVNWPLNNDSIPFFCQELNQKCQRRNDTRTEEYIIFVNLPSEPLPVPSGNGLFAVFIFINRVTENSLVYPLMKSTDNGLCTRQVHIRDRYRNGVFPGFLRYGIELAAVCASSFYQCVKIILHIAASCHLLLFTHLLLRFLFNSSSYKPINI